MPIGGIIEAIVGGGGKGPEGRAANRNNNQQRLDLYGQQIAQWQFEGANQDLQYSYAKASAEAAFQVQKAVALQEWQTNNMLAEAAWITQYTQGEMQYLASVSAQMRDYELQTTINDMQYRSQMRVYEESERVFSEQTRLIADAAQYGYDFTKTQLEFQKQGIALDRQQTRREYQNVRKETMNAYKQAETQYRSELKQSGLQGAELQKAVKERMKQYTLQRDATLREGQAKSGAAAASGAVGNSARRLIDDPLKQAEFAIGALGVELSYFGDQQQMALLRLAESTALAGNLADINVAELNRVRQFAEENANRQLERLYNAENEAISNANFGMYEIQQNARSQWLQADSNRELMPMDPLQLPPPGTIPRPFLPGPIMMPKPLQATNVGKPLTPPRPLKSPEPRLGSPIQVPSQSAAIWGNAIGSAASLGLSAFGPGGFLRGAPSAGNIAGASFPGSYGVPLNTGINLSSYSFTQ